MTGNLRPQVQTPGPGRRQVHPHQLCVCQCAGRWHCVSDLFFFVSIRLLSFSLYRFHLCGIITPFISLNPPTCRAFCHVPGRRLTSHIFGGGKLPDRHLVRHGHPLPPQRLVERPGNQLLWLPQAALPFEEKESQAQISPLHRRMDLLGWVPRHGIYPRW